MYLVLQDFMRLYQAELLLEVKMGNIGPGPRLNDWLRGYAIDATKDKVSRFDWKNTCRSHILTESQWHLSIVLS